MSRFGRRFLRPNIQYFEGPDRHKLIVILLEGVLRRQFNSALERYYKTEIYSFRVRIIPLDQH